MPDDPETTLQELRHRLATEGLPKLSAEALRSFKREDRRDLKLAQPPLSRTVLSLSQKARRLFVRKSDPEWPWRRR
ncbi:hypothetical protein [Microvirga lotononidis]|uniref:hypothetical protein n=1 Tax=Microvirga lotononidis TaxID=864069 RepID=UPI000A51284C|nr:hypothetical protein [Microvirga lotononidis]WQO31777.1 hypothetical protein U0023_30965 [Microvirga lotononidis]